MKVSVLAVVTAALFMVGSAHAADLLVENASEVAAASAADWSGAYLGVHAGYVSATATGEEGDLLDESIDLTGWNGGVYGGVNFVSGNMLFGIDGDIGAGTVEGTADFTDIEGEEDFDGTLTANIDWNAHLRGRVGVTADRLLFYVAGGVAIAETSAVATVESPEPAGAPPAPQITPSAPPVETFDVTSGATHVGYTIGAGIEVALSDNVTLRGEYLYDDYGTQSYAYDLPSPFETITNDVGLTGQTIRVGLGVNF